MNARSTPRLKVGGPTWRKALLIPGTATLAVIAASDAALAHWQWQPPSLVPTIMRSNPHIRLSAIESTFAQFPDRTRQQLVQQNALRVLAQQPLHAIALRQIATTFRSTNPLEAYRYLRLADRISRQDPLTQFALIDLEAARGDLAQTLVHYDRAMMVGYGVDRLLTLLAVGISDPEIREALVPYAHRSWMRALLYSAMARGADPASVARLATSVSRKLGQDEAKILTREILRQLSGNGHLQVAQRFLSSVPAPAPLRAGSMELTAATTDAFFAPFAWTLASGPQLTASLSAVSGAPPGGGVEISITPPATAVALRRVTTLSPGRYAFKHSVGYVPGRPRAGLRWEVACSGGVTLMQKPVSTQTLGSTFTSSFTVPSNCAAQEWRLMASAADSQDVASALVADTYLARQ